MRPMRATGVRGWSRSHSSGGCRRSHARRHGLAELGQPVAQPRRLRLLQPGDPGVAGGGRGVELDRGEPERARSTGPAVTSTNCIRP